MKVRSGNIKDGYNEALRRLALHEGFGSLAENLETAACEADNLAFTLTVFVVFFIGLDVALGNVGDHAHNLARLGDALKQSVVFRFEQLEQSPDCDVLEGSISTGEEAAEISVDTALGLRPVLDEYGVVAHYFC